MKTTIDIPEEALYRAKIVAAQRKTTLKELVLQGLDHVINHAPPETDSERRRELEQILDEMRASNTKPMAPLSREEIYDR